MRLEPLQLATEKERKQNEKTRKNKIIK